MHTLCQRRTYFTPTNASQLIQRFIRQLLSMKRPPPPPPPPPHNSLPPTPTNSLTHTQLPPLNLSSHLLVHILSSLPHRLQSVPFNLKQPAHPDPLITFTCLRAGRGGWQGGGEGGEGMLATQPVIMHTIKTQQ